MAGTDTIPHVYGDITGDFGTPYDGAGVQAHSFFLRSWNALSPTIHSIMPPDVAACDVIFTGHSMGAAECLFGAIELVKNGVGKSVSVLRFSPPKSLTDGFAGPAPAVSDFICPGYDSIPYLPPFGGLNAVVGPVGSYLFGIPIGWVQYGSGWIYDDSTGFAPQPTSFWNSWPSSAAVAATVSVHTVSSQSALIRAICANTGNDAAHASIARLNAQILDSPHPPSVFFPPNPAAWIDYAFQNEIVFRQTVPPALNTTNANAVNTVQGSIQQLRSVAGNVILSNVSGEGFGVAYNGAAKVTFFYEDNLGGFSESFYLATGPSGVNDALLGTFLNFRMAVSGQQTTFLYARVSIVGSPRFVNVFYPPDIGNLVSATGQAQTAGHAGVPAWSDVASTSLLIRRTNGQIYSFWFFRSAPDDVVIKGGVYTPSRVANFVNDMAAMFAWLQGQQWGFVARTPASQAVLPLAIITVNPQDGTAVFTVGGAVGIPRGEPVESGLDAVPIPAKRAASPNQQPEAGERDLYRYGHLANDVQYARSIPLFELSNDRGGATRLQRPANRHADELEGGKSNDAQSRPPFRCASWTSSQQVSPLTFDPCGMVMDFRRTCFVEYSPYSPRPRSLGQSCRRLRGQTPQSFSDHLFRLWSQLSGIGHPQGRSTFRARKSGILATGITRTKTAYR